MSSNNTSPSGQSADQSNSEQQNGNSLVDRLLADNTFCVPDAIVREAVEEYQQFDDLSDDLITSEVVSDFGVVSLDNLDEGVTPCSMLLEVLAVGTDDDPLQGDGLPDALQQTAVVTDGETVGHLKAFESAGHEVLEPGETYLFEGVYDDWYEGMQSVKLTQYTDIHNVADVSAHDNVPEGIADVELNHSFTAEEGLEMLPAYGGDGSTETVTGVPVSINSGEGLIERCLETDEDGEPCRSTVSNGTCNAEHGEPADTELDLRIRGTVDTGLDTVDFQLNRDLIEEVVGISLEEAKGIAREAADRTQVLRMMEQRLLGQTVQFEGSIQRYNGQQGTLFVDDAEVGVHIGSSDASDLLGSVGQRAVAAADAGEIDRELGDEKRVVTEADRNQYVRQPATRIFLDELRAATVRRTYWAADDDTVDEAFDPDADLSPEELDVEEEFLVAPTGHSLKRVLTVATVKNVDETDNGVPAVELAGAVTGENGFERPVDRSEQDSNDDSETGFYVYGSRVTPPAVRAQVQDLEPPTKVLIVGKPNALTDYGAQVDPADITIDMELLVDLEDLAAKNGEPDPSMGGNIGTTLITEIAHHTLNRVAAAQGRETEVHNPQFTADAAFDIDASLQDVAEIVIQECETAYDISRDSINVDIESPLDGATDGTDSSTE